MESQNSDEPENELGPGTIWAVVYGDFMSYLMVFFLVLFAFSSESKTTPDAPSFEDSLSAIQKEFGGSISRERLERLTRKKQEDQVSQQLKDMIHKQGLEGLAKVETDAHWVKLVLTAPILFESGSADIKPEASKILYNLAASLAQVPGEITIAGHTDNVPILGGRFSSNWDLSVARANAVVGLFVQWGVKPQRLSASGYGEFRPVVPNDSPAHQTQNRRIEIGVSRS